MRRRARPHILLRPSHHMRPHRISLNVPQRHPQMRVIHRTRKKSVLPKVPYPIPPRVEIGRIPRVRPPHCHRQRIFLLRYQHQMHVIRHQTIRQNPRPCLRAMPRQIVQIDVPVRVCKENALLIDTPLCHMMWRPSHHGPSKSCHLITMSLDPRFSLYVP